jgi:hypothetical protein
MIPDSLIFAQRPYGQAVCCKDVQDTTCPKPEIGDEVILYLDGDNNLKRRISSQITSIEGKAITGRINKANKYSAKGLNALKRGAEIKFHESNIFTLFKANKK